MHFFVSAAVVILFACLYGTPASAATACCCFDEDAESGEVCGTATTCTSAPVPANSDTIIKCNTECDNIAGILAYSWVSCSGAVLPNPVAGWSANRLVNPCSSGTMDPAPARCNAVGTDTALWATLAHVSCEVSETGCKLSVAGTADSSTAAIRARRVPRSADLHFDTPDAPPDALTFPLYAHPAPAVAERHFTALSPWPRGSRYEIVEVDVLGNETTHGPFVVGTTYGSASAAVAPDLAWGRINRLHADGTQRLAQARVATRSQAFRRFAQASWWGRWSRWSFLIPRWDAKALLQVSEPGIHRVSFDELKGAGSDFSGVFNSHVALTDNGEAVRRHIIDANGDGRFGSGDSVEFLGAVSATLYTDKNTYQLSVDRSLASSPRVLRAPRAWEASRATAFSTFHTEVFENQAGYNAFAQGDDPWHDARMVAEPDAPASVERAFDLPGYAGGDIALNVQLWGINDWQEPGPDHRVFFRLNGEALNGGEVFEYDGLETPELVVTVREALVQERANTLRVELPGDTGFDWDVQSLDKFSVTYERRVETHEGKWSGSFRSGRPVRVGGLSEHAVAWADGTSRIDLSEAPLLPAAFRATSWVVAASAAVQTPTVVPVVPTAAKPVETDYLIITHPLFLEHLDGLVSLQQERGYATHVQSVEQIYAAYSDYQPSAEAVRQFISDSGARFVLLVGGDTYDYLDHLGVGGRSFVPTHYTRTHRMLTFAPSDSSHADHDGDGVPDVALGRLPVRTVTELELFIDKLYAYVPPKHLSFVAGESNVARDFAGTAEGFSAWLPKRWTLSETYADDLGVDAARAALLGELNTGGSLVSYYGHSSPVTWGSSRAGVLLAVDDALTLTNQDPFVMAQWGCWSTYYVHPQKVVLSDAFLLNPGGAVAILGATALSDVSVLNRLGTTFFEHLDSAETLGEALLGALRRRADQEPHSVEALRGFVLLGDPASPLMAPETEH